MTSLVFDRLQTAVKKYNSKLVIMSDIAGLHLDKDVPKGEARDVFNQLTVYLSKFAEENRVIVIATYLPHQIYGGMNVGKTIASYRMALDRELQRWSGFAGALRKEDRTAFDRMTDARRNYASAGSKATRPVVFESMTMSTPHRTIVGHEELENKQIKILCNALKIEMKKELRPT